MSKSIKDRVLTLGASIAKGLTRLDQARTTTVVHAPNTITRADIDKAIAEASRAALARELVQAGKITPNDARDALGYPPIGLKPRPTAADLTQVWIAIDELRESESELHSAHDRMDALLGKIDAALKVLVTEEPK